MPNSVSPPKLSNMITSKELALFFHKNCQKSSLPCKQVENKKKKRVFRKILTIRSDSQFVCLSAHQFLDPFIVQIGG